MPFSVLLVDDHAVVRQGIRAVMKDAPDFTIVGEASDGIEAIKQVERLRPDIVFLDIMMSGLSGLDALPVIRQRSPQTRVVIVSMYDALPFVSEALQGGVLGYVLKAEGIGDIIAAARAALAGRRYLSATLSERSVDEYLGKLKSIGNDPLELLTARERHVMQLAAEGKTCPEIGLALSISERTAERHRGNLMHKLGLHTQTELVVFAMRRNILPPERP